MIRCVRLIHLVLLIVVMPLQNAVGNDGFSVMTWNLEWFYDENQSDTYSDLARQQSAPDRKSWDWKRDAVAAAIAEASPTVVALQEVENRRVLWYLTRALDRNHKLKYREYGFQSLDHHTEQDVGLLCRLDHADVISAGQRYQTRGMLASERFYNLSKHLLATIEVPVGDRKVNVHVLNLHLRAREQAAELRVRQARLAHLWMADLIASGEHVIILGDTNSEEDGGQMREGSDIAALAGRETTTTADDLVDLHTRLPPESRQTHLLPGKHYDRILVSPGLLEDTPGEPDLVFDTVRVAGGLNVRGELDTASEHWERYWETPQDQRDISDHLPLIATFQVK